MACVESLTEAVDTHTHAVMPYENNLPMPARKKTVNLTVDNALLQKASAMKINLSQVLTIHLEEKVREGRAKRWQEENKDILDGYSL